MHKFVNYTIIGSNNGLLPGWCQVIIWTNAGILLIGPLGTNFSEILIEINSFSFKKMHMTTLSAKMEAILSQPQWLTLSYYWTAQVLFNDPHLLLIRLLTHWGRDKMAAILQTTVSNENVSISIKISLKFDPKGPNNNIPALV